MNNYIKIVRKKMKNTMNTRRNFLKLITAGLPAGPLLSSFVQEKKNTPMPTYLPAPDLRRIALLLFNGITYLDFIGFYDPVTRLKSMGYFPDLAWDLCAYTETVQDDFGLEIRPHKVQNDLSSYDLVFVPGGLGTRKLQHDKGFIDWLRTAGQVEYKVSVCTGSLLLGAAGFLKGKRATTNYNVYDLLQPYCGEVVKERIVEDGKVITGGAVATSLDLGLFLCEKFAGEEAREAIRQRMGYRN